MRVLSLATAVALVISVAGFWQSTASAAPPVAVSIQIMPTVYFPVEIGTWTASGAIEDRGTYVRTEARATGSMPDGFGPPEHTGAFKEVFVLSGTKGSLTVKEEALLRPEGEFGVVVGVWQILSGTGDYDGASGHGTDEFDGPAQTLFLAGVISKAD
jgi:hypothetical protein